MNLFFTITINLCDKNFEQSQTPTIVPPNHTNGHRTPKITITCSKSHESCCSGYAPPPQWLAAKQAALFCQSENPLQISFGLANTGTNVGLL